MKKGLIIAFLGSIIFSCCIDIAKRDRATKERDDIYHLRGKYVNSLDSILNGAGGTKIVFLFNYYDCGSCVDSGFVIIKEIQKENQLKNIYVISTMGDPSYYQNRNGYCDYIYSDSKDLIRKELKYIQTPIILLFDSMNQVKDYIFPNLTKPDENRLFVKSVLN